MSGLIQAIRGMNDVTPDDSGYWLALESIIRETIESYGYREIRFPIVEKTELFARSIGEVTDIVEKEMYTFEDRNGDSLTLRPEGTASCVRACIENGLLHNQIQRLWYSGPMFRHERPQKGRYRQFHQFGVEAFGMDGPDIDVELILMTARMWNRLGLDVELQLNSLGDAESRGRYRDVLVSYLTRYESDLDEDSRRRLKSNPLRVLDSKNPQMQDIIENAPKLQEHLDAESVKHFEVLRSLLTSAGVNFTLNSRLVRGLDYYNRTVFEWVTTQLGAQGTICAGGRYDGLVSQLGGKPTTAAGFALGVERLVELAKTALKPDNSPHLYITVGSDTAVTSAINLAETLRTSIPGVRVVTHCGGGSFKSQFKKADKSGALIALILGEDEINNQVVGIKELRQTGKESTEKSQEQESVPLNEIEGVLKQRITKFGA